MRLRTCLAIEAAVGSVVLSALGLSVAWGLDNFGQAAALPAAIASIEPRVEPRDAPVAPTAPAPQTDQRIGLRTEQPTEKPIDPLTAPEVERAAVAPRPAEPARAEPRLSEPASGRSPLPDTDIAFDPAQDDALLAPLRSARPVALKFNRGGSTISLRLDVEGGGRAAFKPTQQAWQSNPRKEIAAYRIDRLLGFGAVAPAIGRVYAVEDLYEVMAESTRFTIPRLRKEMITHTDGDPERELVSGVVSWWIPVVINARLDDIDIDSLDGIAAWRRLLRVGAVIPPKSYPLVRQISNMLLFDFLIDNIDRWTGSNVKADPTGRTIYFMDNTMSFSRDRAGHRKGQGYLKRTQTFSRHIVERLRAMTEAELRAALEPGPDAGPFGPLLSGAEINGVLGRRDAALAYIDELIARHGEAAVLVFP